MPAFSVPENLAFDTYTELVDALNDWLDRSDLSGVAQTMIALAEARMRRRLEPLFNEESATVVVTDGLGALPADCSTLNRVMYNGLWIPQWSKAMASETYSGSQPVAYTIEQGQIRLWPECDVSVTVLYQPNLPQLSEGSPTNSLLGSHPDAYFFGAMMFAEGYLANDARASLFKALWDEALDELERFLLRQKLAGPLVPKFAVP